MGSADVETIVAPATPAGRSGVGVIRVSGPRVLAIALAILRKSPPARYALFAKFFSGAGEIIDQGIALYFCAPHSFTGEDILELHTHGSPVVIDLLLARIIELGARLARPGEFMERAFLNNKVDLAQAEAVADLINASTSQAAQNAIRSLEGELSHKINELVTLLEKARTQLEATINFPEEEEPARTTTLLATTITTLLTRLNELQGVAKQGVVFREGINVVITGKPNAGKSSLFNHLSGREAAIVTSIPGTTRDILPSHIQIDGLPINLLDTAGLRDDPGEIEEEGIKRAWEKIKTADILLLMVDAATSSERTPQDSWFDFLRILPQHAQLAVLYNKIDLSGEEVRRVTVNNIATIYLSLKTKVGIELLKDYIKEAAGVQTGGETGFSARRRHLAALTRAGAALQRAEALLVANAVELVAEELGEAHHSLGEITGEFTADDLLAQIFSEFCIGK